LLNHSVRANYQACIWRHAHIAYSEVPTPKGLGWIEDCNADLLIDWVEGDIMPQDGMEIMETDQQLNSSANAQEESDIQIEISEEDAEIDNILDVLFEDDDSSYR
jgi:hypothetical protein